ncbi:MAG: MarC family protein [Syntrophaceae bacterium]
MTEFWLSFLPIFMAVNAIGLIPIFISFTIDLHEEQIHKIILETVITAAAVALVFLAIGSFLFRILGITVSDFMIAGGALIFVIALTDLLTVEGAKSQQVDPESLGAVPLGVPLIVGPAVLTTILILVPQQGVLPVIAATVSNIAIAGLMMWFSHPIIRLLGKSGARAIAKVSDLILAAIAVMMIRRGLEIFFTGTQSM